MSGEPDAVRCGAVRCGAVRCGRWTRERGLAAVPLSVSQAEPPPGQKPSRFCFAKTDDVLEEAARRLCAI